jgi:hypothetical protein
MGIALGFEYSIEKYQMKMVYLVVPGFVREGM